MPTFAIESVSFTVRGRTFTRTLDNCTSEMIARAVSHAFKQRCGDAAAGLSGADADAAIDKAFASLNEWMRAQPATRGAALPTEESLLVAEAKLWLKGKGVVGKQRDLIKSRADAETAITAVVAQALKAKGSDKSPADVVAAIMAKLEETVRVRLAAAGAGDDDLI